MNVLVTHDQALPPELIPGKTVRDEELMFFQAKAKTPEQARQILLGFFERWSLDLSDYAGRIISVRRA
jgi:hypothetical protein